MKELKKTDGTIARLISVSPSTLTRWKYSDDVGKVVLYKLLDKRFDKLARIAIKEGKKRAKKEINKNLKKMYEDD